MRAERETWSESNESIVKDCRGMSDRKAGVNANIVAATPRP